MSDNTQKKDARCEKDSEENRETVNRHLDLLISLSSWFPKNNIDVSLS